MRVGLFSIVDGGPEFDDGARDRYAELARLAGAADRAGLSTLWVAEHHFHPGGTNPSTPVLLAFLGARSARLRLGSMVSVLPFHAPVALAEEYALLDRLLGGRLEIGVGSGYIELELDAFAVPREARHERFDRALATMRRAWEGAPVRAVEGAASEVRLNVRPLQRPHPPLWVAVQRREAVPFVARMDAGLALVPYATLGGVEELRGQVEEYRAARPAGSPGRVAAALHVYLGPHPELARRHLQRFLDARRATQSTFYLAKVGADPRHARAEHLEATGLVALGGTAEVRRGLEAFAGAGVDELMAIVDFGGLPIEEAERTVEALGGLAGSI